MTRANELLEVRILRSLVPRFLAARLDRKGGWASVGVVEDVRFRGYIFRILHFPHAQEASRDLR